MAALGLISIFSPYISEPTDSSMIEAGSKKSGFSSVLSLLFLDGGFKKQTNKQTG